MNTCSTTSLPKHHFFLGVSYSLRSRGEKDPCLSYFSYRSELRGEKHLLPVAGAIEMIHAFPLVHDDLPCMDNDDFQAEKAQYASAFGEATAFYRNALLVEGLRLIV